MRSRFLPAAVFAALIFATSACGSNTPDPATASAMSSSSSSAVSSPSSSAASSFSTPPPPPPPPAPVVETTPEADVCGSTLPAGWDKDCDGQIDADAPIGDTGCDTSECLIDKNNQGAQQAPAAECTDGAVRNEGGGNYSNCVNGQWQYVSPTFDPNSGDGYGPNQPLPPLCVRFPQQYQC